MPKTKLPPTTRWRGIVVAILCGLLSLTTSSSADSAWVLWLGTGTTYTPFGAYGGTTSEKDCKEAANQLMADMKKDPKQLGEFLKSSSRYLCLPETVDPRGPKGK